VVRLVAAVAVAGALASGALGAATRVTNRAQVGVPGRNATRGYSPSLYVVFASPADYGAGCCTDVDSGEWDGPRYEASGNPSLGGTATIAWRAVFDDGATSVETAARAALVQRWPDVGVASASVPHATAGVTVGRIPAFALFTHSPASGSAQDEDALAFPLCRGLFVVADLSALQPFTDTTGGVAGQYTVNGTLASTYNDEQLRAALAGVSLDGYLRIGKLAAAVRGGVVTGRLTDCRSEPMPSARIRAGRSTSRTRADGRFTIRAPAGKGRTFAVTASAGGSIARVTLRRR
jgi:hypothetical protein